MVECHLAGTGECGEVTQPDSRVCCVRSNKERGRVYETMEGFHQQVVSSHKGTNYKVQGMQPKVDLRSVTQKCIPEVNSKSKLYKCPEQEEEVLK